MSILVLDSIERVGNAVDGRRTTRKETMTLIETTNSEPLLRQGVFIRIASFAHRRRWLQQTGFGTAVAIFVDAVIIRCLIVPATMELTGRRAWWLPALLVRLLPKVEL
jgi:hypothetical protein